MGFCHYMRRRGFLTTAAEDVRWGRLQPQIWLLTQSPAAAPSIRNHREQRKMNEARKRSIRRLAVWRHRDHWPFAIALLAIGLTMLGCGRGEIRGRIKGKITFQGRPVTEGLMLFSNAQKGIYMTAPLKMDGTYEVLTAKGAGLPLETYQVCLSPPLPKVLTGDSEEPAELKAYPNIPSRYRDPKTSGLTLTVASADNRLDIDMQP